MPVTKYDGIKPDYKKMAEVAVGVISDLYSDSTHFIFELLQNAEDALANRPSGWAGSRKIVFDLQRDRITFTHYGRPFNSADVEAICKISETTKEENAIGKFGLGFKSVYVFTKSPEIYSGEESFSIEDYFQPIMAPKPHGIDPEETRIVLPFRTDKEYDIDHIKRGLEDLQPEALLFLGEIEEIRWNIYDGTQGSLKRESADNVALGCNEITIFKFSKNQHSVSNWRVFSRDINYEGRVLNPVKIAFLMEKEKGQLHVKKIKESKLSIFFPSDKETHLGFLMHGPYQSTPSRENIDDQHNPFNLHLIQETGELIVSALIKLRDQNELDVDVLQCLPLDNDRKAGLYAPLYSRVASAFKEEALIPKHPAGYARSHELKIARPGEIRNLLNEEQIRRLYDDGTSAWLSGDITYDRTNELHEYLNKELGISVVQDMSNLLAAFTKDFLEDQPDPWMIKFYEVLDDRYGIPPDALRSLSFIRMQDDAHVAPNSDNNIYLFDPNKEGFPTVKRNLVTEKAKSLFGKMGIGTPDLTAHVRNNILPKYVSSANGEIVGASGDSEYLGDLKMIVDAFADNKEKIPGYLKDIYFISAISHDGQTAWKKPCEVYFSTPSLKEIFEGVDGIFFVREDIEHPKSDLFMEMLQECGVAGCLRPEKIPNPFSDEEKQEFRIERQGDYYCTRDEYCIDWGIAGLKEVIAVLRALPEAERHARSSLLWNCLLDCSNKYEHCFHAEYAWFYRKYKRHTLLASFAKTLNEEKWIADEEGNFHLPSDISLQSLGWERDAFLQQHILFKSDNSSKAAELLGAATGYVNAIIEANEFSVPIEELKKFIAGYRKAAPKSEDEPDVEGAEPSEDEPPIADDDTTFIVPKGEEKYSTRAAGTTEAKMKQERRLDTEKVAIDKILEEEPHLEKMEDPNNEGFDLVEKDADGEVIRWIEVKSLSGAWEGKNPASMTHTQFLKHANEKGERYWLYVVENTREDNCKIYCIQNPAGRSSRYLFDRSWKQFASKPPPKKS